MPLLPTERRKSNATLIFELCVHYSNRDLLVYRNEVFIYYKNLKNKKEKLSFKKKSDISEEIVDRIINQILSVRIFGNKKMDNKK